MSKGRGTHIIEGTGRWHSAWHLHFSIYFSWHLQDAIRRLGLFQGAGAHMWYIHVWTCIHMWYIHVWAHVIHTCMNMYSHVIHTCMNMYSYVIHTCMNTCDTYMYEHVFICDTYMYEHVFIFHILNIGRCQNDINHLTWILIFFLGWLAGGYKVFFKERGREHCTGRLPSGFSCLATAFFDSLPSRCSISVCSVY